MKTKKIEVLAPAGNPAALKAAVFAGADAVYMGRLAVFRQGIGGEFFARRNAGSGAFCPRAQCARVRHG